MKERKIIYEQIRSIQKNEGLLVFDVCNDFRHKNQIKNRNIYDKLYTIKEIKKELIENGFKIEKVIGYLHGSEVLFRLNIFPKLLFWIIFFLDKYVFRNLPLKKFAYLWIIVAKKQN